MEDFTIEQLGLFITLILSGAGATALICFRSRCKTIRCGSCCVIDRYLSDEVKKAQALVPDPVPNPVPDIPNP
tara:strand:+ start:4908 stop:5126 length:219 start_codon:yes stop_codon:yes gene_type:complete